MIKIAAPILALLVCAGMHLTPARADDGDDTLRFYLSRSDLVVLGEFATVPLAIFKEEGVPNYHCEFKIVEVLKGKKPAKETISVTIIRFEIDRADRLPELKQGGKGILFLKGAGNGATPSFQTADVWFGVQRPSPWLARSLKRLAAEKAKPAAPGSPVAFVQEPKAGDKEKLAALLKAVKGPQAGRLNAVIELADYGPAAAPAVPTLIGILRDKDEDLRLNAAITLSKIGKGAVVSLIAELERKDMPAKYHALAALAWIGPDAKDAGQAVLRALADDQEEVRLKAVYAVGRIMPDAKSTLPALMLRLHEKNEDMRAAAREAISRYGASAVPLLNKVLQQEKNSAIKAQAITIVALIGADAKDTRLALRVIFLEGDKETAPAAAEALTKIGPSALPIFTEALKSERESVRGLAVDALGKFETAAVPILLETLADKHADVRKQAAAVLGGMKINDKTIVLALADLLRDRDEDVRASAAQALANTGIAAKFAGVPLVEALADKNAAIASYASAALTQEQGYSAAIFGRLVKMLKSDDATVRARVVEVLHPHGAAAVPHILAAFKDPAAEVRQAAVTSLDNLSGDLGPALPALAALLDDKSEDIRERTCRLLGRVGTPAVPHLVKGFKDASPKVRECTAVTLRTVPPTKAAVDALIVALKDNGENVRYHASWTLGAYGPEAKAAVTPLIEALKNDKAHGVRENAAWAMAYLGPDARAAIPALEAALRDPQASVQNYARGSLQQLQKK